jgi:hypothetical protein
LTGLLVFFGGSATLLWVFGISSLSRAGITQALRRGVFTVFLLPAMLLWLMATGIGFGALPALLLVPLVVRRTQLGPALAATWGGCVLGFIGWALVSWMLRKVAEWILRANRAELRRQPNETELLPPHPTASGRRKHRSKNDSAI